MSRGRSSIFPSPSGGGLGWGRICSLAAVLLLLAVVVACGGSDVIVPPKEEFGGPEFNVAVLASDLGVGRERLAFGVGRRDGPPLKAKSATVRTYYLPPNTETREHRETLTATFEEWPFFTGVFVVYPQFDVAGWWEIVAEFTTPEGLEVTATGALSVKETSATPAVGDPAPASTTPVADQVSDITQITTAQPPNPALYSISIHDALSEEKPLVVGFSTPRYCSTGTCGPQVEQLAELQQGYGNRANVIHVEVYKNPHLFEEGQRPGIDDAVDAVREWNLPTEPWTFVVDSDGIIRAKFEAFTPAQAIEDALLEVLN